MRRTGHLPKFSLLLPLVVVPACYLLAASISAIFLPGHILILRLGDFLLQLAIGFLLICISRRLIGYVLVQLILALTIYIGHGVKIAFLGGPILPSDLYSTLALLRILTPPMAALAVAGPVLVLGLVLWNLRLPRTPSEAATALMIPLAAYVALGLAPRQTIAFVDRAFPYRTWDQLWNYQAMGGTLFLAQAYARAQAEARPAPDMHKVHEALGRLRASTNPKFVARPFHPRNVYFLVLESFWDASLLEAAKFSRDPLHPAFRALWEAGGKSGALSPAFAGGTANAEFELLCGMPSTFVLGVPFEFALLNEVPCLPRILSERGYDTFAAHANVPAYWNRASAYPRLGIETSVFVEDFKTDDRNGRYLSDASFLRQALNHLDDDTTAPRFAHLLTISGHWPYLLSERRPPVVTSESGEETVGAFANSLWYSSRETAEAIARIRRRDPDGIVVAVGDHAPYLGDNFAGYSESKVLTSSWSSFRPEMFVTAGRTPLVVIDGREGPVQVGTVPMFAIPNLILELLGHKHPTGMTPFANPGPGNIRPLAHGSVLHAAPDEPAALCTSESKSKRCGKISTWIDDARIVWDDLLRGSQFTLRAIDERPWPPAYVAHAGGGIAGRTYTNSLEALDESYARGFRFFEVDLSWTADDYLALTHDWADWYVPHFVGATTEPPTRADFLEMRRHDGLTPLALPQLLDWLRKHSDAWVVTDIKERNVDGLTRIAEVAGELTERFVPQIYETSEFPAVRKLGFKDIILTLYRTKAGDDEVVEFAGQHELFAITLPEWRARATDIVRRLRRLGTPVYAHTINRAHRARQMAERGVTGVYTDHLPAKPSPHGDSGRRTAAGSVLK